MVPVPRVSFQRRNNYTVLGPGGQRLPANRQMARGVSRPFGFVGHPNSPTLLITGLDDYVSNPYYQKNKEDIPLEYRLHGAWEAQWDRIVKEQQITRQTLYEIMDKVPEGTYTSMRNQPLMTSPLANVDNFKKVVPTFLETFKVYLHEGTNVFVNSSQRGRLGILICENNPKIAPSKADIKENDHDFYIASQEEVLEEIARRDNRFMEAIVRLNDIIKDHDPFVGYQFAIVLRAIKGNLPIANAMGALREYIMDTKRINATTPEDRWNEFNRVYVAFKENPTSLYASYLIRQGYITQIIRDINGEIIWTTQKGRANWFNLGTNPTKLRDAIIHSIAIYDPDLKEDNMFVTLEAEIKSKGIPTR